MPDLQGLISRVQGLERVAGFCDRAVVWMTAATAIVAALYFIATIFARSANKNLKAAESALAQAKEAKSAADSRDKDLRIAELTNSSLRLLAVTSERRIVMGDRDGDKEKRQALFAEVRKYAGTPFLVASKSDSEARQLAGDIFHALKSSGWKPIPSKTPIPETVIRNGVQILTLEESPFKDDNRIELRQSPSGRAAMAVVNLLQMDLGPPLGPLFWGVHPESVYSDPKILSPILRAGFKFPHGAVVILVGERPTEEIEAEIAKQIKNKKQ